MQILLSILAFPSTNEIALKLQLSIHLPQLIHFSEIILGEVPACMCNFPALLPNPVTAHDQARTVLSASAMDQSARNDQINGLDYVVVVGVEDNLVGQIDRQVDNFQPQRLAIRVAPFRVLIQFDNPRDPRLLLEPRPRDRGLRLTATVLPVTEDAEVIDVWYLN